MHLFLSAALFLAMTLPCRAASPPWLSVSPPPGVDVQHRSGPSLLFTPETIGPGVALPDFDGDGRADLYLVNGAEGGTKEHIAQRHPDHLYRNAGARFEDATVPSGIAGTGMGQGVTAADLDNDGYVDLVLTGYQELRVLKNNGDGTFTPSPAALPPLAYYSGSSAADVDRDGFLDLYLALYVLFDYRVAQPPAAVQARDRAVVPSLGPLSYAGAANVLLHARGDGAYDDVTLDAGVGDNDLGGSRTLGTLFTDLDRDGWPDLLVANDQSPFSLYRNKKGLRYENAGAAAWLRDSRGNMGIAAGDYDGDGALDLVITHFDHEHNGVYRSMGRRLLRFQDAAVRSGLASSDWTTVGWGACFADLDADGWSDLVIANGHLFPPGLVAGKPLPARAAPIPQAPHLYRNRTGRDFESITATGFTTAAPVVQGRGLATGDTDGDGAPDLVCAVNNGPPLLFRNVVEPRGSHVVIELAGTQSNRDAVGARVEILAPGAAGRPALVMRERRAGNGYFSTDAAPLHFGLGQATGTVTARVFWPSGATSDVTVPVNARVRIVE